jgi:hypothetical protein
MSPADAPAWLNRPKVLTSLRNPFSSLCDSAASRDVLRPTVHPSKGSADFVVLRWCRPNPTCRSCPRGLRYAGREASDQSGSTQGVRSRNLCSGRDLIVRWGQSVMGLIHRRFHRRCQIIRQHKLDPKLVKAYARDFCGTKVLKDATRAGREGSSSSRLIRRKTTVPLSCATQKLRPPGQKVVAWSAESFSQEFRHSLDRLSHQTKITARAVRLKNRVHNRRGLKRLLIRPCSRR